MNWFLRKSLSLGRGSLVSWRHTAPMCTHNIPTCQQQRRNMSARAVRRMIDIGCSLARIAPPGARAGSRDHSLESSHVRIWASKTSWRSSRPTARSQRRTPRWPSMPSSTRSRQRLRQVTKLVSQALEASSEACEVLEKVGTRPQASLCSSRRAPHLRSRQGRRLRTSSRSDMPRSRIASLAL